MSFCAALGVCLFFFFFKQKTAYEIRPRDWSSDVCSSDLNRQSQEKAAEDHERSAPPFTPAGPRAFQKNIERESEVTGRERVVPGDARIWKHCRRERIDH